MEIKVFTELYITTLAVPINLSVISGKEESFVILH